MGEDIGREGLQNLSDNLTLVDTGMTGGSIINWSSSNPAVISNIGVIHPQASAMDVTLTATLSLGGNTETKAFSVRVAAVNLSDAALSNIEITGGGTLRDASGLNDQIRAADSGNGTITVTVTDSGSDGSTKEDICSG
jgi:hypothetical protein